MRSVDDILFFRSDLSPFLVHMTKQNGKTSAKDVLYAILSERKINSGESAVSDARFGINTTNMDEEIKKKCFYASCFTETPLNEIHTLLEIKYRKINLEPYGLVFMKKNLAEKGVSPCLYINNLKGNKKELFYALCSMIEDNVEIAAKFLPLISVFGNKIQSPGSDEPKGSVDFLWEREWRYPYAEGSLSFKNEDIFIGLCEHKYIDEFESKFEPIKFVDPTRNMKWYATKLIESRQRLDIKYSVV